MVSATTEVAGKANRDSHQVQLATDDPISDLIWLSTMVVVPTISRLAHSKILASLHHFSRADRLRSNLLDKVRFTAVHKVAQVSDLNKQARAGEDQAARGQVEGAREGQLDQEVLEEVPQVGQVDKEEEDKEWEDLVARAWADAIQDRKAMGQHRISLVNQLQAEDLSNHNSNLTSSRSRLLQATGQRRLQRWVSRCRSKKANALLCEYLIHPLLGYCIF